MTDYHGPNSATDTEYLRAEITRLTSALVTARLESANRLAAIHAALGAAADGEADPFAYLRDQLTEETEAGNSGSGR